MLRIRIVARSNWVPVLALILALASTAPCNACQSESESKNRLTISKVKRTIVKLRELHTKPDKPKDGEWLKTHKEKGQTFSQYRKSDPNVLSRRRRKLYVQPIGDFTKTDNELISTSADFLSIYFQCEVVINKTLAESVIPASAQRKHPSWGVHQLLTSHILAVSYTHLTLPTKRIV